ncbi:MAG: c-type cytochrome [Gammaproteobacteria bacterium]|nr:c-type cytochrome [Gammaproteobacteria bacterium]
MNLLFLTRLSLITIALITPFNSIAKDVEIKLSFTPSLQNGKDIYETCASCHLPEGWGNADGTYPQIAGQHQNVLIQQLLAIRSGKRENPTMFPFVQERTIGGYQSLADVVVYISTLPMHPKHSKGPWTKGSREYKEGKTLFSQFCAACHGAAGQGDNSTQTPKLYGQHYPYLKRQLKLIKQDLRSVNPAMKTIVNSLNTNQLDSIVNYISQLEVPKEEKAPSLNWRNTDFY